MDSKLYPIVLLIVSFQRCHSDLQCNDFTLRSREYCATSTLQCPEDMGVSFKLHTSRMQQWVSSDDIPVSALNKDKVIFLVHGFTEAINETWVQEMKDELLTKSDDIVEDYSLLLVDWSRGAGVPIYEYEKAARNTQTVGYGVAIFMDSLKMMGTNYSTMWCIGHSLGSHVCGHAGRNIKGYRRGDKLGRITGLDPAGPAFRESSVSRCSLNKNDAIFVDIIHTNGADRNPAGRTAPTYFGRLSPMGTVDFYPNGGQVQPGCRTNDDGLLTALQESQVHACYHARSVEYFKESIRKPCLFWTNYSCGNYDYLPGSCSQLTGMKYGIMGFHADNVKAVRNGVFYLNTSMSLTPDECYENQENQESSIPIATLALVGIALVVSAILALLFTSLA